MSDKAYDTHGYVCYLMASDHGLLYTSQVGGYACHHPEIRAMCILFAERADADRFEKAMDALFCDDGSKYGGWCTDGIDEEAAAVIDAALKAMEYPSLHLSVDRSRLNLCQEAWVWVVADDGTHGVLTWQNSD